MEIYNKSSAGNRQHGVTRISLLNHGLSSDSDIASSSIHLWNKRYGGPSLMLD